MAILKFVRVLRCSTIFIFLDPQRTQRLKELLEMRFEFPFNLNGKWTMALLKRPIKARIQVLVHNWGPS